MNYLPKKLEKLRKHYNYSQSRLAEELGVSTVDYMGFENGRSMLNYKQVLKLAELYHLEVIDIFLNNDNIDLSEADKSDTDTLNLEYFIPKKTIITRIKEHPFIAGGLFGILVAVIIVTSIIYNNNKDRPYVSYADNTDRVSCSNTSLIYIDNLGAVKGAGDNSNGQISNLPSDKATKVCEGSDFSIVLLNDGTLLQQGLNEKDQKQINDLENIIDIAAGEKHVVAVDNKGRVFAFGDNSKEQLEVRDFSDIKNVYASKQGTICVDINGEIYYTGSFIGTSLLNKSFNILDVETSDENLIILKEDGTCDYVASHDNPAYYEITRWNNVVDVTCGNTYFAALKNDGTVKVVSSSFKTKEVDNWQNIIAIDGNDDCLIGFDGENIYGVGNNEYHLFASEEKETKKLNKVENIRIDYNNKEVNVTFDEVENAISYDVTLILSEDNEITTNFKKGKAVSFKTDNFDDNSIYTIKVVAVGDENYENSPASSSDFVFLKEIEPSSKDKITIRNDVVGSERYAFESYLTDLGVKRITSIRDENITCEDGIETVLEISGITPGSTYTESELNARNIEYTYCKLDLGEEDGTDLDN